MNNWYMYNPASFLENEMHKLFWDFAKQTDHLNLGRRTDLTMINKKKEKLQNCGPQSKLKESEKDKYLDIAREF